MIEGYIFRQKLPNLESLERTQLSYKPHTSPLTCMHLTPHHGISASKDGEIKVWEKKDGKPFNHLVR